ncbi:MGH1-like glycoside hydrolase domain-containing protein [Aureimonas sp. SK2]|uniref:MGH1-like glycoside hydrolase domain-containing protein n=1 Tax=Aureimonas sp. SK2 TaxID=3015992 RepID=UPI002443A7BF|nr:glucosidase [Aureimonas sp. SK2]
MRAPASIFDTAEGKRLRDAEAGGWRHWGPYLSERQWGTVREDYSADGDAWGYLPHDHARSRAYRWGEDGIAGFCDRHQYWCLSLALWNGADPIVKERMFGLTNEEGNHGEDVKEVWWYLDGTPTHSFQTMIYRYPQGPFPYNDLVAENGRRRGTDLPEYELADTGILDAQRYFDVEIAYAKAGPGDLLMRVSVVNRGPDAATLQILPQLVARNIWSWGTAGEKPSLTLAADGSVETRHPSAPPMRFRALHPVRMLFCENETNMRRLDGVGPDGAFKDAINDHVTGKRNAPLPDHGTKCAALSDHVLASGERVTLRYRLSPDAAPPLEAPAFDAIYAQRQAEADEFYAALQSDIADPDARLVQRQALGSLLWSKQVYRYDVKRWLDGDPASPPPPPERRRGRNADWTHLANSDVILMPDKWEYPWYASWDLAFHAISAAIVDPDLAKAQILLLTREWYMHPSGQLPAYEWAFGDANPPIHAFAALRVYRMDEALTGVADRDFLERIFHKLMINFTWWVNRKDTEGRNLFQGGFLGLDNIGVFDRSAPIPGGGYIEQSDGTAWMAMYALNLMRMALELARENPVYEDVATKFFEHFLTIASAMTHVGGSEAEKDADPGRGLWDEADGFFYDALILPDGSETTLRVRSLVGLIPLCAVEVLDADIAERHPFFAARLSWMLRNRPDLTGQVSRFSEPGKDQRLLLSLLRRQRMTALLRRMLDENEFLSPHGLRSLSKAHARQPFRLDLAGSHFEVHYEPGTSQAGIFGGNSNWRGPVWMPLNVMIIEALLEFERFYGEAYKIECPTGSGRTMGLADISDAISRRLCGLFLKDGNGRRPFRADGKSGTDPATIDPEDADRVTFNEFFDGDTGQGLGASHQTGWTALVALLLQPRRIVRGQSLPVSPTVAATSSAMTERTTAW